MPKKEDSLKPKLITREGSKIKYSDLIICHFPNHLHYIEPFLGTGAIFFNKPLAKHNLLNDSSLFIYNFFKELENIDLLKEKVEKTFVYNKIISENIDKIEYQIIRQINSMYGGGSANFRHTNDNPKKVFLESLDRFKDHYLEYLKYAKITNMDCFKFIKSLSKDKIYSGFIYCDPPYSMNKGRLKDNKGWDILKLEQLIIKLINTTILFAISEYDNSEVLALFSKYGLHVTFISKVLNNLGKNELRSEIIATNYKTIPKEEIQYSLF